MELDRLAEAEAMAILERFADAGQRFSVLSEEAGRRDFGAEYPCVVIDPIDGSLNAKQGLPVFAVMLSLAAGPHLEDVVLGAVTNLATGQRWHAARGGGAYLNGQRLSVLRSSARGHIDCLGLESSPHSLSSARLLVEKARKLRILGSMALSICHTASGGMDVFCCPIRGRAFDMSASLLILAEAGGTATDLSGQALAGVPVDLQSRTTLLAASNPDVHQMALGFLAADSPARA